MEHDFILSPSLLAADFSNIQKELAQLEEAGIKWVHWDVMDGHFVPNITLGPPIISSCRKNSSLFFDVHLMISNPEDYILNFCEAGADLICVHAEACVHLDSVISSIKKMDKKAGVALNPHTPLSILEHILFRLDMVLIMSVNPGFGGQKFIPYTLKKIRSLSNIIKRERLNTLIEVDGGVTIENCKEIIRAGADVLVSGSAFFKHPPYKERYEKFLREGRLG